jgi:beta-lactamase class A
MIQTGMLHRRLFLAAGAAGVMSASGVRAASRAAAAEALARLEHEIGGRVGVAALNTADGAWIGRRADERFAMCSTFKALLAAAVLARIDQGALRGETIVSYGRADLLAYAPRTTARVGEGGMSVLDLCAAAVETSDNTAANLLLGLVGGPAGLTGWLRQLGDVTTRLDRNEPTLNSNLPGDPRDTTTPRAYARTLGRVLLGGVLTASGRRRLTGWMIRCETGVHRLRAGLPPNWQAGDKTGTGENGSVNDVAILWPPNRPPVIVASFLSASPRLADDLSTAQARVAHIVVDSFR